MRSTRPLEERRPLPIVTSGSTQTRRAEERRVPIAPKTIAYRTSEIPHGGTAALSRQNWDLLVGKDERGRSITISAMADHETIPLSTLARDIIQAGCYQELTVTGPAPAEAAKLLGGVTPDQLLAVPVASWPHAAAMLGGLWLWHDSLHESHEIVQQSPAALNRPSASEYALNDGGSKDAEASLAFWHAIMHRREGDFFNSKYWNARCRNHPAYAGVAAGAKPILANAGDALGRWTQRLARGGWDADAFVDFVEFAHENPPDPSQAIAVELQRLEWRVLFEHCARAAVG